MPKKPRSRRTLDPGLEANPLLPLRLRGHSRPLNPSAQPDPFDVNIFCTLFGHTWVPRTDDSDPQWNTTKAMNVLMPSTDRKTRYYDECQRCHIQREVDLGRSFPDSIEDVVDEKRVVGKP